jgi:hypothetical protein
MRGTEATGAPSVISADVIVEGVEEVEDEDQEDDEDCEPLC